MTFSRQDQFSVAPSAVAFVEGRANPHSLTITKSRILPDAKGAYTLLANTWMCKYTDGTFGPLPAATVVTAFATGAATGKVGETWRYFKAGDVLRVVEPYVTVNVTTGWAANDTIAFVVDGNSATMTVAGTGGVTAANIVTEAVTFINTNPTLMPLVSAVNGGTVLYLLGKSPNSVSVSVTASTAGAGDAAINGPGGTPSALVANTSVGTISSIATDGTITLTGNASVAVPIGMHIGVMPIVSKIYGYYDMDLDMSLLDRYHLSPVSEAHGTYEQLLSYCDEILKAQFSQLNIGQKF